MFKVKVCGLRDNISDIVRLEPDYIGFIFYPKSQRYTKELPADVLAAIPDNVQKVGVFVDQPVEEVIDKVKRFGLDCVQLHGHESVEYCLCVKEKADVGIIKVFSGNDLPPREVMITYGESIDYYLFDTRNESYGGTGQKFDWTMIKDLKLEKPVFLSGGISIDDIDAIRESGIEIYAVDVNSKFEIKPGFKDIGLIKRLLESRK